MDSELAYQLSDHIAAEAVRDIQREHRTRLEALKGGTVTVTWSFAGSKPESHTGVVEGVVETNKGQSLMLTLPTRERDEEHVLGFREVSERGVSREVPIIAKTGKAIVSNPPLYLPLRSILSIEEAP